MRRGSLKLRLMLAAAVMILFALCVAGVGLDLLFERHLERREVVSLEAKALDLLSRLDVDADGAPRLDELPTYERFAEPASGIYWQVSNEAGELHSPSLWDQELPAPPDRPPGDRWRMRRTGQVFGANVLLIEREIRAGPSQTPVLIQLAKDDAVLRSAIREFALEITIGLLLLWLVLMLAAFLQVRLGLAPLEPLREQLERLRRHPQARLPDGHPREIEPLSLAINALAEARTVDLERAKRRAADLAHSLKTPLAALSAQSRRAREAGAVDAADGLDRAIASASASLEAELARARSAAARGRQETSRTGIASTVDGILAVIERTADGGRIAFEIDVPDALEVPVSASELSEILGELVTNAVRHARRRVRVTGTSSGTAHIVSVSDDGPGIEAGRAEAALIRGARLDEVGPGHGFGLSIVKDLVEATDGALSLEPGPLGGLQVTLRWQGS